ncbi:MAG: hypothetical protein LBQ88_02845 [Treponema sp.]|jgi:hypothetical protein|nr:hypothetical protein [Treponema sp.]
MRISTKNGLRSGSGGPWKHGRKTGGNHAGGVYCVLNLPAFLVHGLMILCDEDFINARSYFGRREEFYKALRTFFRAFEFQTWEDFLLFVTAHARGG